MIKGKDTAAAGEEEVAAEGGRNKNRNRNRNRNRNKSGAGRKAGAPVLVLALRPWLTRFVGQNHTNQFSHCQP